MDAGEIEGTAEALYRLAGLDSGDGAKPLELARRLLGADAVRVVHAAALPGDGAFAVVNGAPRIYLRSKLPRNRRRWVLSHELAEWWLWRERYREPDIEHIADALAAALIAPRQLFLRVVRRDGLELPLLALRFSVTESCAALRVGETVGTPTALLAPSRPVRIRGDEREWPNEAALWQAARASAALPGIVRSQLSDQPRRYVLSVSQ